MKHILHELWIETLRQLFRYKEPRSERLILTRHAFIKMQEYQLDIDTLMDVFKYGEEVSTNMIIRQYCDCLVGITIKKDMTRVNDTRYLIITCWKGGEK